MEPKSYWTLAFFRLFNIIQLSYQIINFTYFYGIIYIHVATATGKQIFFKPDYLFVSLPFDNLFRRFFKSMAVFAGYRQKACLYRAYTNKIGTRHLYNCSIIFLILPWYPPLPGIFLVDSWCFLGSSFVSAIPDKHQENTKQTRTKHGEAVVIRTVLEEYQCSYTGGFWVSSRWFENRYFIYQNE